MTVMEGWRDILFEIMGRKLELLGIGGFGGEKTERMIKADGRRFEDEVLGKMAGDLRLVGVLVVRAESEGERF